MQEQQAGQHEATEDVETKNQVATGETAAVAADAQDVKAEQRTHFFALANSLIAALDPVTPHLWTEKLNRRELDGMRLIYEARTAQETEQGQSGRISAIERMRYLEEGLLRLQGTLALARSPSFPQARAHVEEMRKRIARLKQQIAAAIVAEERHKREEQDKKKIEGNKGDQGEKAKQAAQAEKA